MRACDEGSVPGLVREDGADDGKRQDKEQGFYEDDSEYGGNRAALLFPVILESSVGPFENSLRADGHRVEPEKQ